MRPAKKRPSMSRKALIAESCRSKATNVRTCAWQAREMVLQSSDEITNHTRKEVTQRSHGKFWRVNRDVLMSAMFDNESRSFMRCEQTSRCFTNYSNTSLFSHQQEEQKGRLTASSSATPLASWTTQSRTGPNLRHSSATSFDNKSSTSPGATFECQESTMKAHMFEGWG